MPLPSFYLKGEPAMRTVIGGLLSAFILAITFMFSNLKLQFLLQRQNPQISFIEEKNAFEEGASIKITNGNFPVAVSLSGALDDIVRHDPSYVKFSTHLVDFQKGKVTRTEVPMSRCTDSYYENFYEVEEEAAGELHLMKTEPTRELLCIDFDAVDIDLRGTFSSGNYAILDIIAMPCSIDLKEAFKFADSKIGSDCQHDLDEIKRYLGPVQMTIYFNQERLDLNQYDDSRVKRYSSFQKTIVDTN